MSKSKSILDLTNTEAFEFFIQQSSYINFNLPLYFDFTELLTKLSKKIISSDIFLLFKKGEDPKKYEEVNYKIFHNKDGEYSWRRLEIIHPILYIGLLRLITDKNNWDYIKSKFDEFQGNEKIHCSSIPSKSTDKRSDKSVQILQWWEQNEKESIKLALEYDYVLNTDIKNCYPSFYTHSIEWALHGKEESKNRINSRFEKTNNLGSNIDTLVQKMSFGQTNGIPQGSILMDFIAEIILGYADKLLIEKIPAEVGDYKVIRYRDDYRIFVNTQESGKKILKILTEVLIDLGLAISTDKTNISDDIISSSIKADKRYWLSTHNNNWAHIYSDGNKIVSSRMSIETRLHSIREFGLRFPNSGQLSKQLHIFDSLIENNILKKNSELCISLLVDIALQSPKTYDVIASLISKFLYSCESKEQVLNKIFNKFEKIPNTDMMEIWLQRIILGASKDDARDYGSNKLSSIAKGKTMELWNNNWLNSNDLKKIINARNNIIDKTKLKELSQRIKPSEVNIFSY